MKHLRLFIFFSGIAFLSSCSMRVHTQITSLAPRGTQVDTSVTVFHLKDMAPPDAQVLGLVTITDPGFATRCQYEVVVELARKEARKAGANALKIFHHVEPLPMGGSCHEISARLLLLSSAPKDSAERASHYLAQQKLPPDTMVYNGGLMPNVYFRGEECNIAKLRTIYKATDSQEALRKLNGSRFWNGVSMVLSFSGGFGIGYSVQGARHYWSKVDQSLMLGSLGAITLGFVTQLKANNKLRKSISAFNAKVKTGGLSLRLLPCERGARLGVAYRF
ncbi:MAG: hypothetical protein WC150_07675 [Bacteroidia bacterium]